jgi:tape measure domain-containing protein
MAVAVVDVQVKSSGATQQLRAVQQGAQATSQAVDKLNATTAAASAKMRGLSSAVAGFQGALASAAPVLALAAGIAAAANAALKFSNEIDRNRQQLTLFTKEVGATNQIIAQLKVTADATSLGLPGLLEATKTLAAYGVSAKNAGTAIKMLGDLALGDSEKLQRFAVNLGQIGSIGKAYTVDLKQFAMAGIPIFEALSKVMGKSTSEVLRLAEQGQVTYPIVVKAIAELTKEGASFYNGAEKGGTDLDRSLNQLIGTFENLQTIVGTAVGPAAVAAVLLLKDALDGALLVVKYLSNEFEYFSGLIGKSDFGHAIVNELKFVAKYLQQNPSLMMALNPSTKLLGPVGEFIGPLAQLAKGNKKETSGTTANSEEAARQKYLADVAKKNTADVLADKLKKETEINDKIAKINKDTELQLGDARLNYERQIADFRQATLKRITDMERDLGDQRIKANFDLQQSNLKLSGSRQFIGQTQDISRAIVSGKSPAEIQSLQTTRDNAKTLNDAAIARRQIEFDSTMKKIQLERTLTDFKRGIEREIGEMQKGYARQTGDILTKAGTNIQLAMIKGAQEVERIMMRITTGKTPPAARPLPAAARPTNQQANSAAAGVGMVITPGMTRPRPLDAATRAGMQGLPGSRAMQVDGANNIRLFSPATAKLGKETQSLMQLNTQSEIAAKVALQNENTKLLAESTTAVLQQSTAGLNAAKEKNQVDQRTLDLIVSGTNPALAAQFAQNEQLNAQNMAALDNQTKKVGLSAKDLNLLNQQIDKSPQILEGLNQQAIKQKEITDATQATMKAADDLKALYSDIGMTIKSGVIDAIQGAIDGTKRLQDVATGLLKNIANKLLDVAVNFALFGTMSGTGTGGGLLGGLIPRAKGGSVSGGTPYLVGERGPELFMPGRSGGIAPTGSFGSGTNVVVNVDATGSNVQGDDQSSKQLGVMLAAAVQKELIKQKRPGGILA